MTKVLIVEDDHNLRENMMIELEVQGYDTLEASDGKGALYILRASEQLPDIIVSDIAMPDMDGYDLLRYIRSDARWYGIPVLFVTAFGDKDSIRVSKELGVDDYIVKPFEMDDLIVAIENKLKRVQAFTKAAEGNLDEARRKLLNMMSHELRTPLTAIYGGSEALAMSLEDTPDDTVHNLVNLIQKGADRLNRLTGKALALLQIDSGQLKKAYRQSRQNYDILEIIHMAVGIIQNEILLNERQVKIVQNVPQEEIQVAGVFEYLVMMIEELLRNAVAFSPRNGIVELNVCCEDSRVYIFIQDQGPGIAAADLERVWDRFVQINREEYEQQGTGLGLEIVRKTAHIHGGDCKIESLPEGGTKVILTLPIISEA